MRSRSAPVQASVHGVAKLVFLVALLALAGCSQPAPAQDPRAAAAEAAAQALPAAVDAHTGAVRGFVLDQAGDAVEGAIVTILPPRTDATTTADGAFAFGGLAEGRHLLRVRGPRIDPADETYVQVVAGEAHPTAVRLDVQRHQVVPAVHSSDWDLSVDDSVAGKDIVTYSFAANKLTNESLVAQVEFTWDATTPLTQEIEATVSLGAGAPAARLTGPSPIVLRVNTTLGDGAVAQIVTADVASVPQQQPLGKTAVDQKVHVRIDVFDGFLPRSDWTYSKDGAYPVPAS